MPDNILKNMTLFVDGRGYAGKVDEMTPPKLTIKKEEYRAGGMDAPVDIDMGMEKLEASFVLSSYDKDVLKLFGLAPGNEVPLTMRAASQSDDGTVVPVVIKVRGQITEIDSGSWRPGDKATLTLMMNPTYYSHDVDGEQIHEIDIKNMVRKIAGVDQLAGMRAALGQ